MVLWKALTRKQILLVFGPILQTNGGQVNYSIETENLITGSTQAQKSEIISLGTNGWHVKTHSDYLFQVEAKDRPIQFVFGLKISGFCHNESCLSIRS
jgi:hypothetical protein